MLITRRSQISGEINTRDVACTQEQVELWQEGMKIQDAMPDVEAPLREYVKSGITPTEWVETFGRPPRMPRRMREQR